MLNHIGLAQIIGVVALVAALYCVRSSLARSALRGWHESHPHSVKWMHRHRLLVELTEVSLAAVFFLVGGAKLVGRHDMILLFQDIGVGQWLRYLTGTLEVAGAALLLIPLLSGPSAFALGGIMIVATLIELFVLHRPPVAALACLSGHTFVAWARLSHSRGAWLQPLSVFTKKTSPVRDTLGNQGIDPPRAPCPCSSSRQGRQGITSHANFANNSERNCGGRE